MVISIPLTITNTVEAQHEDRKRGNLLKRVAKIAAIIGAVGGLLQGIGTLGTGFKDAVGVFSGWLASASHGATVLPEPASQSYPPLADQPPQAPALNTFDRPPPSTASHETAAWGEARWTKPCGEAGVPACR